jgi:KDO2-lipid IV(A) lauroyltransferase
MFNYLIYRLGQFLALKLPLKVTYRVASFLADTHYFFCFRDRRLVRENLKAIFPEKPAREIRKICIRVFRNFAKYLVDFFRFEKLDREYIEENIRIEGIGYFDQALARGKGAIALTAHLGNWELGGVVIALLGYPFWAVALPHKHKKVDDFFNFQRQRKGVKVMPLGRAVRQCLAVLKKNEIVALVGDRDFTEKGLILDFFGKPAFFPEGAAAFALQTGAAVVPGFMLRNPDDSFTLKIEKPLEYTVCGDKEKDLAALINQFKNIFEQYIREYPDQWYMFRRFWAQ